MEIKGWDYDYETLFCWNDRDKFASSPDIVCENKVSDTMCMIYAISEVSMGNYKGYLAIFKHKREPSLYLNISNFCFPIQDIFFNSPGTLLILKTQVYFKKLHCIKCPLLVIDLLENRFSIVKTHSYNSCFKIVETNRNLYGFEADALQTAYDQNLKDFIRSRIRYNDLKWHPLGEISDFSKLYLGTH
ncbi:MAG: hypothetical protein RSD32_08360 [Oscillospiraceae bacterium]